VNTWLLITIIGIGTVLMRVSFIGALGSRGVPRALEAPLRYVAPAVLAAIAFPAIVAPEGTADLTPGNLRLLAALAAGVVAWRTRNIGLTIVVGLAGLALLEALV
jgi:branched-subunit amino acid transport protein